MTQPRDGLSACIDEVRHFLPAQGPISVFVHHNTLHAFEHLPFERAVESASRMFSAEPYMDLEFYQQQLRNGRITTEALHEIVAEEHATKCHQGFLGGAIQGAKWIAMACAELPLELDEASLAFLLSEADLLDTSIFKDSVMDLARSIHQLPTRGGAQGPSANRNPAPAQPLNPQATRLAASALLPFLAAFLDQGLSYWPMPSRHLGLFRCVLEALRTPGPKTRILAVLTDLANQEVAAGRAATASLRYSLEHLGVDPENCAEWLLQAAQTLPGFLGLIARLEGEPELASEGSPPQSLAEALAIRVLFERAALVVAAAEGEPLRKDETPLPHHSSASYQAYLILRGIAAMGAKSALLRSSDSKELERFLEFALALSDLERRRLLHLSYERSHRNEVLGALAAHRRHLDPKRANTPKAQLIFCIDDREEAFRRHLEELDPSLETFGTAGFFGVAVSFRGLRDGYSAPLCPVVQKPAHAVIERARSPEDPRAKIFSRRRRLVSDLLLGSYVSSRGLFRSALVTFLLGLFSLFPLSLRVLFPSFSERISRLLARSFLPPPATELTLEREVQEKGDLDLFPGFTEAEMAERVEHVLRDIGLIHGFSRLVLLIGHGSSSLNNPLASAYDCGACGGRKGGPNARLFAQMANDPEVRARLSQRGIEIPADTRFVGGHHDTASEGITFFDPELLPDSHREAFLGVHQTLEQTRARSAHERCRRFENASLRISEAGALSHVESRTADLAQPRPELGHAGNAIAVFGRRSLTRGLFLDRRAFLISYDSTTDGNAEVLGRLLAAMGPVGAGINLEYFFSRVDSERYGSGTKLPQNVLGLLGIVSGSLGDLRTGLPVQMTEIRRFACW